MRSALVFGGSGQIGRPLLAGMCAGGWQVFAVSRAPQAAMESPLQLRWLQGDLWQVDGLPHAVDAIFSCGPLDLFAQWYARSTIACARIIAFGSTSVDIKQSSIDGEERELAARLREGERGVLAAAAARGAAATLLRPTLIYGAGMDRSLTRITEIARRWGRFALPSDARGLRQPVHADDLASAALQVVDRTATYAQSYALPGGETLPYRAMVRRVLDAMHPPCTLHLLPPPVFRALLGVARASGAVGDFSDAAFMRMREDLVFDSVPAQRDFGYAPRAFAPEAVMFDRASRASD